MLTMKHFMMFAAAAAMALPLSAQQNNGRTAAETELFHVDVGARIDWQLDRQDSHTDDSNTGFKAKQLVVRLDGTIVDGLTYSLRQRLNKPSKDASFFDATDWVYLNYYYKGWNFQAGKEVVAIGGFEYDIAPINLFSTSVFTANIPCYDLGVSVGYDIKSTDRLTFQATQSPFFTGDNRNMYSYNLMWNGHHGFFTSIYSANLLEYAKGKYISYIALGNKFTFDRVDLCLDFTNRAASHQTYFFKDCTFAGELAWRPADAWRVHGRVTYDVNNAGTDADLVVLPGTELTMAGAGVEFWPLKKKRQSLRLHANCYYSWGKNANAADAMQNKTLFINAGITWQMNCLSLHR